MCICLHYGRGLTETRVNSANCPVHREPGLPLTTGEGTVSRDSALALIDDANRWQAAYNRTRNELAETVAECDRLRGQLDALTAERDDWRDRQMRSGAAAKDNFDAVRSERQWREIAEARVSALTGALEQIVAEAERWNDGEFALWRKDDLVNALVRIRAVVAAATPDTPEEK